MERIKLTTSARICLVVGALLLPACGSENGSSASQEVDQPSWLFVQTATSGTLIDNDDGTWTLNLSGVPPVTFEFQDRPGRDVRKISNEAFLELWNSGSDSFRIDPPNAALVVAAASDDGDVAIVELLSAEYAPAGGSRPAMLTYVIRPLALREGHAGLAHYSDRHDPLHAIPSSLGHVSVFIDKATYCYFPVCTCHTKDACNAASGCTWVSPDLGIPFCGNCKAGDEQCGNMT